MSRSIRGRYRLALAAALFVSALVPTGCAKRFGGPWPWGQDQSAELAKYGPVAVQRIEEMQKQTKAIRKASPAEQETFAAEMAKKMQGETNPVVRLAMVDMLKGIDARYSGAVLYAGLKDPEADIRVACCEGWARRPGPEATRILAETLSSDTDKNVRLAAVEAASSAQDKDAVRALGLALEDPDPALQYHAVASLRSVTGKDIGEDVNAWRQIAKQADPPVRTKSVAQRMRTIF